MQSNINMHPDKIPLTSRRVLMLPYRAQSRFFRAV